MMERIKEGIRKGNGGIDRNENVLLLLIRRCDVVVAAILPVQDDRRARIGKGKSHDGVLLIELVLVVMIVVH